MEVDFDRQTVFDNNRAFVRKALAMNDARPCACCCPDISIPSGWRAVYDMSIT